MKFKVEEGVKRGEEGEGEEDEEREGLGSERT
jgi:hypothetical protein